MIIIKFLYYIVYRLFKLIPRREPIDHLLASSFIAILFTTNLVTIIVLIELILHAYFNAAEQITVGIVLIALFLIIYIYCKWYFIKKEKYIEIITDFDEKNKSSLKLMGVLGIIYTVATFLGFYVLAVYSSNGTFF